MRATPIIEPLSLDEAYLDVTENLQGIATATEIARLIRATIHTETGLTASAGVSYNKFLAKLASDHRKPDGLFARDFTALDLRAKDEAFLRTPFGKGGPHYFISAVALTTGRFALIASASRSAPKTRSHATC